jgi:hypothetical protein
MNGRRPLGFGEDDPRRDNISPYSGARLPGPLPVGDDSATPASGGSAASRAAETPVDGSVPVIFDVDGSVYSLRRATGDERYGWNTVPVAPEQAAAILERAIQQRRVNPRLLPLLVSASEQLAGLHQRGTFVLLWVRPEMHFEKVASAPSAPRMSPAPAPPPPEAPEDMMPLVQAAVLREAAATGVPFCEECARAAAARAAAGS